MPDIKPVGDDNGCQIVAEEIAVPACGDKPDFDVIFSERDMQKVSQLEREFPNKDTRCIEEALVNNDYDLQKARAALAMGY